MYKMHFEYALHYNDKHFLFFLACSKVVTQCIFFFFLRRLIWNTKTVALRKMM